MLDKPARAFALPGEGEDARITAESDDTDEQYEGCLSFFDVRGLVPRPLHITVETTTLTGELVTSRDQGMVTI
ncbi:peptide deformylase [Nocardia pseudovaccinii]|uniref:peptide deformylase n=1 Tax=Nocardia pseudovaccinii TaxID=189540 RepID=UPI0009FF1344